MKRIQFNNLKEIYKALEKDVISPKMAISITNKALNLLTIPIQENKISKENVLEQIKKLEVLSNEFNIKLTYFGEQSKVFDLPNIARR